MSMGSYTFIINEKWWNNIGNDVSSLDAFLKAKNGDYAKAIKQFFSIPQIKEWAERNNWKDVFDEWKSPRDSDLETNLTAGIDIGDKKLYRNWICDVLGVFLSLLGIDFMKDLDDNFVVNRFYMENYKER